MEGCNFEGKKFWVLRVDTGEDILLSIKEFIKENNIKQGLVVMGYGTMAQVGIHWVLHNRFPAENRLDKWEGGIELLSMNGIIVEGEPHIHFTASTMYGSFGGHMEEGCITYVLCEIGIVELEGPIMSREMVSIATDSQDKPVKRPRLRFSQD